MLKSHEKFHSANGRRLILIVDDELVNRELLAEILKEEYETIFAADGQEALDQVRKYREDLSLVLLDLMMPVKPGLEALREMKADPTISGIPVIVLTADQNAEVQSLSVGAIDYIPKPYPDAEIIKARIIKAIELTEDRQIIQVTERDPLTGLYNREYFYRYAEQYDQHHRETEMDAIVVDINHFHMINERFGREYGDEVLRGIGEKIRETVAETGGIVCRREADTFMVYCPHGLDYRVILENASIGLAGDESVNSHIRLRMGVYAKADKELEIERRFDRAKMAADTVRNSFTKTIGIYDSTMHERELYAEQLIDDFREAIEQKQFLVYYQPKFDIRPKAPVLTSAEALVRWKHPEFGMISPGIFIPLFEENGLIQEVDRYVWREAAAQIRDWKDRLGFSLPVSVNVSRIDMYDPELLSRFGEILREYRLGPSELLLEITESAYTQDSEQIIETVNSLREMGFIIEMDDFGTGYSSLNMISELPIDALKLDMHFVRSAFRDQKDTRMLEVIIGIADHLGVPVIAEGVENEEQLLALKALGCDIVQGFYFSKPVPAEAFENFISVRMELGPEDLVPEEMELRAPAEAIAGSDNQQDAEQENLFAKPRRKQAIRLSAVNIIFVVVALLLAAGLVISESMITSGSQKIRDANARYLSAELAAAELMNASDYLTNSVRAYAVTGDIRYLDNYFEEAKVTCRRDAALETLDRLLEGRGGSAYEDLSKALMHSNELMEIEYHAMRLRQTAEGVPDVRVPIEVSSVRLSSAEAEMDPMAQGEQAERLVFGEEYEAYKKLIRSYTDMCTEQLITTLRLEEELTREEMARVIMVQLLLLILLLADVFAEMLFITFNVRVPLGELVAGIKAREAVRPSGAAELRFVTQTYNEMLEEDIKAQNKLSREVFNDKLTGLHNRRYYEFFMENSDREHIAMIVIDVDDFKAINDSYGHDVGDRVLKKVAGILDRSFRSVDAVCRIGGDEFAVVMTRANSSMSQLIISKLDSANESLMNPRDGLPKVSVSAGIAFADRKNPAGDIFKDADSALYEAKAAGKRSCCIYGK